MNEHAVISPLSPPVLPSSRTHTHVPRPLAQDDNDDDDSFPGGRTSTRHTFIMPEHHTRAGEVRNKLAESLMTFLSCCLPPLRTVTESQISQLQRNDLSTADRYCHDGSAVVAPSPPADSSLYVVKHLPSAELLLRLSQTKQG